MSKTLDSLSRELGDAVETVRKSIMRVEGRQRLPASGWLWSEEGLIVTANHVVRRDEELRAAFDGGEVVRAELLGRDPQRDLALLKVSTAGFDVQAAKTAQQAVVGNLVLAVGMPGSSIMATMGILSSRSAGWGRGATDGFLQTDVVMLPGFSGGPLINTAGSVLGMNTSGLMRGASLAVPSIRIEKSVAAILAHGRVRQGYLGVSLQPVRLSSVAGEDIGQPTGLMVVGVEADSPAERGGILQGDVLVRLDDKPLGSLDGLFLELSEERIGTTVRLQTVRGGKALELAVEIGERI